jgi:putative two-component system response regulator
MRQKLMMRRMPFRHALRASRADDGRMEDVDLHGLRTAWLAHRVARMLGLGEASAAAIAKAARSHDIGKQFIASAVLNKPAQLQPDERRQVEMHAIFGAWHLMSGDPMQPRQPDLAVKVALLHHEWWNGQGYPFGLAGTAIPVAARVTAVADVFDALTRRRCYKRAWRREQAMAYLLEQRGRQFDPQCAEAMHSVAAALPDDWAAQAVSAQSAPAAPLYELSIGSACTV